MLPGTAPSVAKPASQASRTPRCRRQASASGLRSTGAAVAGPARSGSRPAPRSRRATRVYAAAQATTANPAGSSRTHQRSPAYGRTCWPQPTGDNQDSQAGPAESPAARSRYAPPRTAAASPVAVRALRLTWALTAATAPNAMPVPAQAEPKATDPPAGSPAAARPAAASAPIATAVPDAPTSAAGSAPPP